MEVITINDELFKNYKLASISNRLLSLAAYEHGMETRIYRNPSQQNVKKWRDYYLNLSKQEFIKKLSAFYTAGQVSSTIFIIERSSLPVIRNIMDKIETIERYILLFRNWFPEYYFIGGEIDLYINFKIPLGKSFELIEVNSQPKIKELSRYQDVIVVIRPQLGIIELRGSDKTGNSKIINRLMEILNIKAYQMRFTENEVNKLMEFVIVSNSNFRFETGPISSARLSSAQKLDGKKESLTQTPQFKQSLQDGKIISAYIYMSYNFIYPELNQNEDKENEEMDSITRDSEFGFNINFLEGRVYFGTALAEKQIKLIINIILTDIINLDEKREKGKKTRQKSLNEPGVLFEKEN